MIKNELEKVFRQVRIYFAYAACLLAVLGIALYLKGKMIIISGAEATLLGTQDFSSLILIPLMTAIVLADTVAAEQSSGTLRLLLIQPVSRASVWTSKFLAGLIVSATIVCFMWLSTFTVFGLIFGFGSWGSHILITKVEPSSTFTLCIKSYGLQFLVLLPITSFNLMISTLCRTPSTSISVALVSVFLGVFLAALGEQDSGTSDWFYPHLALPSYITPGMSTFNLPATSLAESIFILTLWTGLFISTGFWVFLRGDY